MHNSLKVKQGQAYTTKGIILSQGKNLGKLIERRAKEDQMNKKTNYVKLFTAQFSREQIEVNMRALAHLWTVCILGFSYLAFQCVFFKGWKCFATWSWLLADFLIIAASIMAWFRVGRDIYE